jgi:hypothetical protein
MHRSLILQRGLAGSAPIGEPDDCSCPHDAGRACQQLVVSSAAEQSNQPSNQQSIGEEMKRFGKRALASAIAAGTIGLGALTVAAPAAHAATGMECFYGGIAKAHAWHYATTYPDDGFWDVEYGNITNWGYQNCGGR